MPMVLEVEGDEFAMILVNGKGSGGFQVVDTPADLDLWDWNVAPFPAGGFSLVFQTSGGVSEPTASYPDYPFLTSTSVPDQQWPGSKLYTIKKNNVLVGWFEADTSTPAKLMWWSNGVGLSNNRIAVRAGDTLAFAPIGALPTFAVRPLQWPQTPV